MAINLFKKFNGEKNELPTVADEAVGSVNGWAGPDAGWCEAYFRNKGEEHKDWIVVTNNGCYFKADAIFMTWYTNKDGKIVAKANWSNAALQRTLAAIKRGEEPPRDPNYQT